jgi:indolepyruvate ferredoxin oxidoreductase
MGGEGVPWVGVAPSPGKNTCSPISATQIASLRHPCVRQAVSSGANITYKILYNDATAMTGQHVDGELSPQQSLSS